MPTKTSNSKSAWSAKDIYDMIFSTYGNAHVNANKARAKEASKYMIPYIPEKEIMLTTGKYNTGKISTNLLDSIYNASQRTGVPLDIALGLAGRESTLGIGRGFKKGKSVSGTDLYSNWQQIQTIPNNKAQMKKWNSLLGRTDLTDEDYDFKSGFLIRAQDSLENTKPLDENPIDNALKFYQTGKYNPGDSRHTQMVEDDAKVLMSDPAIQKWLKTKTETQMKCGGRRKAQLGLDIREGGIAIPIAPNMYYMDGRSHDNGGIAIGPNNKNGLEVEGGEVVKVGKNDVKVFSSVPLLRGVSPAQLVMGGANPNKVFAAQEEFKDRNRINDDGTRYEVGGEKIYTPSKSIQRQIQETGKITIGGAPTIGGLRTAKYIKGLATAKGYMKKINNNIFNKADNYINKTLQGLINKHKITPNQADAYKKFYDEIIGVNGVNIPKTASLFVNNESKEMKAGGIYIKPSKRGTFTAAATKHGMGVQEFASKVLANKEDYSPAMVKKANFARNTSRWKKEYGGLSSENSSNYEPNLKGVKVTPSSENIFNEDVYRVSKGNFQDVLSDSANKAADFMSNWYTGRKSTGKFNDQLEFIENRASLPTIVRGIASGSGAANYTGSPTSNFINVNPAVPKTNWGEEGKHRGDYVSRLIHEMAHSYSMYRKTPDSKAIENHEASPTLKKLQSYMGDSFKMFPLNSEDTENAGEYYARLMQMREAMGADPTRTDYTEKELNPWLNRFGLPTGERGTWMMNNLVDANNNNLGISRKLNSNTFTNKPFKAAYGTSLDTRTKLLRRLEEKKNKRGNYNGGEFGGAGAGSVIMKQPEFITDTITKRYLVPVTQNFNDAFRDACNSGKTEFMFDGKLYNTNLGDNPNNNTAGSNRRSTIIVPIEHKEIRRRKKEFGGSMIYTINGNVRNGLSLRPKAKYGKIDKKDKDVKVGQDGLIYKRAADGEWYTDGTKHVAFKEIENSTRTSRRDIFKTSGEDKLNWIGDENDKFISASSTIPDVGRQINLKLSKPKRTYVGGYDEEEKETKKIGSLTYEKNESGKWVPASKQSTTTTRDGGRPKDFGMTRTGVNHPNGNYKYHPLTGEKINEIGVVETSEPSVKGTTKVNSKSNSTPRGEVTKTSTPKSATKTTTKGADVKYGTPLKEKKESLYMTGIKNNSITPLRAGMEKIKSPSSTGGGTQSKDGRWVGQYKTTNIGDWIGLGSNLAGTIASYFMTKNAINKMPEPIKPVMAQAAKLKTRYNVEPQLTEIREAEQMNRASVRRNTQSSNTSLAREQRLMNEARGARNTLYGQKENIETQLINQDRLNRQSVMKDNVRAYNEYLNRVTATKMAQNEMRASNINNLISGLTGSVNSILGNIESRRATNNTLRAIAASNPNVDARLIGGFDYYIDPITKKKYNKNQQYVGTING